MFRVNSEGVCFPGDESTYNTLTAVNDLKEKVVTDFLLGPYTQENVINTLHRFEMTKILTQGNPDVKRELNLSKTNLLLYKLQDTKAELEDSCDPFKRLQARTRYRLAEMYAKTKRRIPDLCGEDYFSAILL